jgi:pyruvate dehydrogenase kinase 2/3/4
MSSYIWDKVNHYAAFPQTPVSLQQMIRFGQSPSQGTLYVTSAQIMFCYIEFGPPALVRYLGGQFLLEELPVRLAHRIKELDSLPHGLSDMPSIQKVKHWYAQSFGRAVIHYIIVLLS